MKTIKDILSQFGYITKPQLSELAEHFACTRVVIKWSGMPRERLPAWEAIERIEEVEKKNIDYCRSVFLSAQDADKLKEVFNIVQ